MAGLSDRSGCHARQPDSRQPDFKHSPRADIVRAGRLRTRAGCRLAKKKGLIDAKLEKHGIDFVEAQSLWNDPMILEIPAKTEDESRFLLTGGMQWSAIITYRGSNVRLVSVRRARTEEAALYES